jgi:hypothetical protein
LQEKKISGSHQAKKKKGAAFVETNLRPVLLSHHPRKICSFENNYFSAFIKQIQFLTRKSSGGHHAKEKRKKPKPEEQEGIPQRQHYPPEERRGDRNPEYHEEQQKDVA